jgi:muramoyltetrapeptide carboxypeptidase
MVKVSRPQPLPSGGLVRLVAPASPYDAQVLEVGRSVLARRGLRVGPPPPLDRQDRYLAAPDRERAKDLVDALLDPTADLVMAARGGYGVTRLLPVLESQRDALVAASPRLVCGFSDLTALHAFLWGRLGWVSVHGPVCTSLGQEPPGATDHLFRVLSGTCRGTVIPGVSLAGSGVVEGPLVGGNLAVLAALSGTPWMPPLTGAVLLLEDVTEKPHRLDRMLTQLWQATGGLPGVVGLALGRFTGCDDEDKGHRGDDTVAEVTSRWALPAVRGLPVGHAPPNLAVPHGARVRLDADAGTLTLVEEAVGLPSGADRV